MNYGRKSVLRKEKQITSTATLVRKKFYVIFFKTLLICFLAIIVVGGCAGIGIFKGIIEQSGRDHIILSDPTTGEWYLILMIYINYIKFDERIISSSEFYPNNWNR